MLKGGVPRRGQVEAWTAGSGAATHTPGVVADDVPSQSPESGTTDSFNFRGRVRDVATLSIK